MKEGRLTRPQHWLDFRPFRMAFTPENITVEQSEKEVNEAWSRCYSPQAIEAALEKIRHRPFSERATLFATRLAFRGIYFPQIRARQWVSLVWANRGSIARLVLEGYELKRKSGRRVKAVSQPEATIRIDAKPAVVEEQVDTLQEK